MTLQIKAHLHRLLRSQLPIATLIGLLGFAGSAIVGLLVGIPEPKFHDEFSYLLAADTFAHGRLTNPTHPMWIHFESFHIIHQPTSHVQISACPGIVLAIGQLIAGHPIVGVWMSFGVMCAAVSAGCCMPGSSAMGYFGWRSRVDESGPRHCRLLGAKLLGWRGCSDGRCAGARRDTASHAPAPCYAFIAHRHRDWRSWPIAVPLKDCSLVCRPVVF